MVVGFPKPHTTRSRVSKPVPVWSEDQSSRRSETNIEDAFRVMFSLSSSREKAVTGWRMYPIITCEIDPDDLVGVGESLRPLQ